MSSRYARVTLPSDLPGALRPDPVTAAPSVLERDSEAYAGGRTTWRLAVVGIGATVVAGLVYFGTVGTRGGQLVGALIIGGRPASSTTVAGAEEVLATLSRSTLAVGTIIVIAIALAQRRPRLAVAATLAIVGANVSTQLLKTFILDRTDLLGGMFYPLPNSFPSGHATAAASIAVAALLVLPPLLRAPTVIASAVIVAIVGVSTMVAGWHRMGDAIGGVFVATAWGAGLGSLLAWRRGVESVGRRTTRIGRLASTVPIIIGAAILALGGLAYVIAAIDPLDVLILLAERGGSPALFGVGVSLTVGSSLLALGALGYALRDARLDPRVALPHPPPDG